MEGKLSISRENLLS